VFVADDHPVVRAGLIALLGRRPDMKVIAQAAGWPEAVEKVVQLRPDVAVLDLRMPGMDGVEAIRLIRSRAPSTRIALITAFLGEEDVYRCIRAGAKGYLPKGSSREELYACVHAIHRGEAWIPPAIASKLAERTGMPGLTLRELDVLRWMVRGKSNKEIADSLNLSEGTVKTHVNHILKKLGVSGRTEAVTQALRDGFVHLD
jgi:DNA-binding NarL/FixJ family response regulator